MPYNPNQGRGRTFTQREIRAYNTFIRKLLTSGKLTSDMLTPEVCNIHRKFQSMQQDIERLKLASNE